MAKQKGFAGINPAAQLLQGFTEEPAQPEAEQNTGSTGTPSKGEAKTTGGSVKRFNLALYSPWLLDDLKKLATMKQSGSVNALINDILTAYTEANADLIEQYNNTFTK